MSLLQTTTLIIGLIAIGLVILIVAAWVVVDLLSPEPSDSQKRMKSVLSRRSTKNEAFNQWLEEQTQHENIKKSKSIINAYADKMGLTLLLQQAGITTPTSTFCIIYIIMPFAIGLYLFLNVDLPLIGSLIIMLSPIGIIAYLFYRKKKRYEKLEQQLPDALNLMTSSLRAGHAFASSITLMASELVEPIKPIFVNLSNDLQLGIPVGESLEKMTDEVKISDYQIFSTAIMVQRETGGNLAEIMDQLAFTIRDRAKLKRHISVLTSQARLSALVVSSAPVVMYFILQFLMPEYIKSLEDAPIGPPLLVMCVLINLLGFYIMQRIAQIRI